MLQAGFPVIGKTAAHNHMPTRAVKPQCLDWKPALGTRNNSALPNHKILFFWVPGAQGVIEDTRENPGKQKVHGCIAQLHPETWPICGPGNI